MNIRIEEENLKAGVLSLVIAVVEILHEVMRHQAVRRMEGNSLSPEQIERLGRALLEVERVIEALKTEQGLHEAVDQIRDGLDTLVDDLIDLEVPAACPKEGVMESARAINRSPGAGASCA